MQAIATRLGDLTCRVVEPGGPVRLCVVLCHGFGAPGDDLVALAHEAVKIAPELGESVRFVFPEGPLSLGDMGYGEARAWWPIDFGGLSEAVRRGPSALATYREAEPEGLPQARRMLAALVDELSRKSDLPVGRIVLGGFSQGAMLATDLALRLEEAPAALMVFSGNLVSAAEWRKRVIGRAGLRVVISHGRQDPLLPFSSAEALNEMFSAAGLKVEFVPFEGGHAIPDVALEKFAALLRAATS